MKEDVIIIGGGAAGLCTAVTLKRLDRNLSVRLIEALPRVGKKLALTGNGRCNISNREISVSRYHGKNPEFAEFALKKYNRTVCEDFFADLGVPFVYEGDKAYPASLQAASVVDCLRFAADDLGVLVNTETRVGNIQLTKDGYKVIAGNLSFFADNVVVAAGLLSGGEAVGCRGDIIALLKRSGFKTVPMYPAIVQLKTNTETVKQLKGIKINAAVTLSCEGNVLRREYGEVLFCDYGLSGPPILQVSGTAAKHKNCTVSLDAAGGKTFKELEFELSRRAEKLKNRKLEEFFTGMLNKRLGQVVLKNAGLSLASPVSSLNASEIRKIAAGLKNMCFTVTGNTGFTSSQVTSGGLDTSQFDPKTMMCRECRGLYAVGEILDIDGDCGGFNLQWAWSSAMCAANGIAKGKTK